MNAVSAPIRVLAVDDRPLMREGIAAVIQAEQALRS
jgi:DNA-binding NarL/FixJ family response regulator